MTAINKNARGFWFLLTLNFDFLLFFGGILSALATFCYFFG